MKNLLLFLSIAFIYSTGKAQFTTTNAPQIGNTIDLYVIDSNAVDYNNEVGADATWDYSGYKWYTGESRTISVLDPADTSNMGLFSTMDGALSIEGFFITYFKDSSNKRESHGFIFNETQMGLGSVVASFIDSANPEQLYSYPMDFGDVVTDDFDGTVTLNLGSMTTLPMIGKSTIKVDGKGTLKLTNTSYTDVLRYKLVDTMGIFLTTADTIPDVNIIRNQYEYYDFSVSNLPIFLHTYVTFVDPANPGSSGEYSIVLSLDKPTQTMDVKQNNMEEIMIYPVPSSNHITIELPSEIQSATISVIDELGRIIIHSTVNNKTKTIDVSQLNKGTYFVKIVSATHSITKRIIVR